MILDRVGNILLKGNPMDGKVEFTRNLMVKAIKEGMNGIYVALNDTGEEIVEWFRKFDVEPKVVDCVSKMLDPSLKNNNVIKRVSSPFDFTGITVNVSVYLKESYKRHVKSFIVFDSLSTLLMYTNLQAVSRFLNVITMRVKLTKSLAVYLIEESMHDEKTISILERMFDDVLKYSEQLSQISP